MKATTTRTECTPEEEAFQRRVQVVWEDSIKIDPRIPRAWVEATLRRKYFGHETAIPRARAGNGKERRDGNC